jgi:hypothetical protein
MVQQVTIKSQAGKPIRPLVEVAIKSQLKSLEHGITRTRERLALFEARLGISTAEMERSIRSGEIEETLDTIDWQMEAEALRLLEEQYDALREARID